MIIESENLRYKLTPAVAEEEVNEAPAPGLDISVWVVRAAEA
ncbi:hypothetical protein QTL95_24280 [Rhizobium sp. S152]|nr:hypothetical protein [Rhizobium sp. S152]MDM9629020.1 hypothetical protein [Rhizobium sp. S152]